MTFIHWFNSCVKKSHVYKRLSFFDIVTSVSSHVTTVSWFTACQTCITPLRNHAQSHLSLWSSYHSMHGPRRCTCAGVLDVDGDQCRPKPCVVFLCGAISILATMDNHIPRSAVMTWNRGIACCVVCSFMMTDRMDDCLWYVSSSTWTNHPYLVPSCIHSTLVIFTLSLRVKSAVSCTVFCVRWLLTSR